MTDRVRLSGLTFVLPAGWLDITDDLPAGSPPTLGKEDGIGVIQFSVAKCRSGKLPNIDMPALREMLEEFGRVHGLGAPQEINAGSARGDNRFVAAEFVLSDQWAAVWYLTNGQDVALVTYVTQMPDDPRVNSELAEASQVVAHLDFD